MNIKDILKTSTTHIIPEYEKLTAHKMSNVSHYSQVGCLVVILEYL
jgi:hypothetical protein